MILVTNDDGVYSPGIQTLAKRLRELDTVVIVAPDRERSAAGHSMTLHRPLLIEEIKDGIYSVNGTPTDCVNIAVKGMLGETPRLVVSGINKGPNLGDDVTYSGTVAGAIEGTLLGIPSIAISLAARENFRFAEAAEVAVRTVERIDPRGKKYYWIGGGEPDWEREEGTDLDAVDKKSVSITPLHLDLTDYSSFDRLKSLEGMSYVQPAKHGSSE
jgi:5'-nucleotidase